MEAARGYIKEGAARHPPRPYSRLKGPSPSPEAFLSARLGGETEMCPNFRIHLARWKDSWMQRALHRLLRRFLRARGWSSVARIDASGRKRTPVYLCRDGKAHLADRPPLMGDR
jgi:hypothetical protein